MSLPVVAQRFIDAITIGDADAARSCYAPDADIWHNFDDITQTVDAASLHHRHKVTPYLGRTVRGRVDTTWLRGREVWNGTHHGPHGRGLAHSPHSV